MNRLVVVSAIVALATVASAQTPPRGSLPPTAPRPQSPVSPFPPMPQFRSRVDIVHLDVSVLDRNRRPVRGLGPADFTVSENGVPQVITVFSAVDIPAPEPPSAPWMRDVASDVGSNQDVRERRVFVIIIDDAAIQFDVFAMTNVKALARRVIDGFGPSDLAAVIFTSDNRGSQDFTTDRGRLLAAIDRYHAGGRSGDLMDMLFYRMSVETVRHTVEALSTLPDRRKAVIYIGQGVPLDLDAVAAPAAMGLSADGGGSAISTRGVMGQLAYLMGLAFQAARRANVNVYTLDVCGLRAPPPPATCVPGMEVDYLRNVATATGGRAVVDSNDFEAGVAAIFEENASYYLLGYQSTDPRADGRYRRIDVRVSRPGVEVRTRSGYLAERPDAAKRRAELEARPLGAALAGVLPKSDLPMSLSAAPFAIPGKKEAAVAIILNVQQPIRETGVRTVEKVDLQVSAFNTDGKAFGSTRLRADVVVRADATGLAEYEVLSRIDLRPGRYQLRTAAHVGSLATSGSLYHDVEVPDFGAAPVSLSGVVLVADPSPIVAPREALRAVIPIVPTTRRSFQTGDRTSAFVRVYQGGRSALADVPLRIQLQSDRAVLVMDRREVLSASVFDARSRSVDVTVEVPLSWLAAGAYLLSVDAAVGRATAARQVRIAVR